MRVANKLLIFQFFLAYFFNVQVGMEDLAWTVLFSLWFLTVKSALCDLGKIG